MLRPRTFIGAGSVALALAPALAIGQSPGITAVDTPSPAWQGTPLTVTAGASVPFSYSGTKQHYVTFTSGPKAECSAGVPMANKTGSWSGECTFRTAGTYVFVCPNHHIPPYGTMDGTIRVVAATPTPEATATPLPDASPTPEPPTGGGGPTVQPQTSLKLNLASGQRGTRVRGRVEVQQAASRLEVTLTARRVRVGRVVRAALAPGRVSFSVPLNAKGRRALRKSKRLEVTVTVVLNELKRSQKVRLRR
jgi:plastocyanin